ncbi:hypothetical protein AN2V17_23190 [Vallitalea sp. AN17-2]|uniref:Uncharacterized protein n=1 Tax=Vallitalea maricola TaxID=3074433 RepID=A0ACB5UJF3_9FIRM|nr:hypothetical protein AN2V17_23190 [Vallitalea sp. AN17-2]
MDGEPGNFYMDVKLAGETFTFTIPRHGTSVNLSKFNSNFHRYLVLPLLH